MVSETKASETIRGYDQIAMIGMAGRFPGSPNLAQFWRNLTAGVESICSLSLDEMRAAGVAPEKLASPDYIGAKGILADSDLFDARYFDLNEQEATVMDPQFRLFLETVVEAMEDAGYATDDVNRRTGIFAGSGSNTYQEYLRANPQLVNYIGQFRALLLNEKDYLPAWAAYKLNLTGPCVAVQSACATSLVAVHMARQSLLNGECDIAIAGAVSLLFPQRAGYRYVEGGLLSPDGRCRAFDAKAMGSVPGEGVGVVVLRRLNDAINQGDAVRAVIKASSINNDGAHKIGFLAPSENGIATAVAESIAISGIDCESIRYIEAHGTAAPLADPIEVAALVRGLRTQTSKKEFCGIGSVKSNIGHLDAAAGLAGLIKTVLALENGIIPPSLNCDEPNPLIKFPQTPFYVVTKAENWDRNGKPRRAAVNSFGIGGTNVHVILEEAPPRQIERAPGVEQLILLSARSESALVKASENLADYLDRSPDISISGLAHTLCLGRRAHECRRALVLSDMSEAAKLLRRGDPASTASETDEESILTVVFRNRGSEYIGVGAGLYRDEPVFRREIDRSAAISTALLGVDIRSLIDLSSGNTSGSLEQLAQEKVSSTLSVAVEYALAKLLISWGVNPQAVIGEGTGEYAAACIANLLSIDEALSLIGAGNRPPGTINHASSPRLAFFSTALGRWTDPAERFEIEEWVTTLRRQEDSFQASELPVDHQNRLLLEIGLQGSCPNLEGEPPQSVIATLRHEREGGSDRAKLLTALGKLWLAYVPIDWQSVYRFEKPFRIPLPTYPFERQRYMAGANDNAFPRRNEGLIGEKESAAKEQDELMNVLQAVVAEVWATYLGLPRVGLNERFFELGGDSITATRIVMTIRETLQVDLPLRSIIDHPTVASFVQEIERAAQQLETDVHENARLVREIAALPDDQTRERIASA